MNSSGHRAIVLSTGYYYAAFGMAISPTTGKRYWAGVFLKEPDRTAAWSRVGTVSKTILDQTYARVTVRWSGGWRHAPPGPDHRAALLPGAEASRRRNVAGLRNHHEHVVDAQVESRPPLRRSAPSTRQGRQLGHLAADHDHSLTDPSPSVVTRPQSAGARDQSARKAPRGTVLVHQTRRAPDADHQTAGLQAAGREDP